MPRHTATAFAVVLLFLVANGAAGQSSTQPDTSCLEVTFPTGQWKSDDNYRVLVTNYCHEDITAFSAGIKRGDARFGRSEDYLNLLAFQPDPNPADPYWARDILRVGSTVRMDLPFTYGSGELPRPNVLVDGILFADGSSAGTSDAITRMASFRRRVLKEFREIRSELSELLTDPDSKARVRREAAAVSPEATSRNMHLVSFLREAIWVVDKHPDIWGSFLQHKREDIDTLIRVYEAALDAGPGQ